MSMRISKLALAPAFMIAACAPESGTPEGASVECALGQEATFGEDCVLESVGEGAFTIHHPDSTFQRIRFDAQTGLVTAADGADEIALETDPSAGSMEFAIGTARYRIKRGALISPTP